MEMNCASNGDGRAPEAPTPATRGTLARRRRPLRFLSLFQRRTAPGRPAGAVSTRALAAALGLLAAAALLAVRASYTAPRADVSVLEDSLVAYERCKRTHRCPRAFSYYDVANATHAFESSAYRGGERDHASPCPTNCRKSILCMRVVRARAPLLVLAAAAPPPAACWRAVPYAWAQGALALSATAQQHSSDL